MRSDGNSDAGCHYVNDVAGRQLCHGGNSGATVDSATNRCDLLHDGNSSQAKHAFTSIRTSIGLLQPFRPTPAVWIPCPCRIWRGQTRRSHVTLSSTTASLPKRSTDKPQVRSTIASVSPRLATASWRRAWRSCRLGDVVSHRVAASSTRASLPE